MHTYPGGYYNTLLNKHGRFLDIGHQNGFSSVHPCWPYAHNLIERSMLLLCDRIIKSFPRSLACDSNCSSQSFETPRPSESPFSISSYSICCRGPQQLQAAAFSSWMLQENDTYAWFTASDETGFFNQVPTPVGNGVITISSEKNINGCGPSGI